MSEEKSEFILAAIEATQDTIRAIDQKIGFLLIFLVLPIADISGMTEAFGLSSDATDLGGSLVRLHNLLMLVFIATWAVAFMISMRCITAIENPSDYVDKEGGNHLGSFFSAGWYKFKLCNAIFQPHKLLEPPKLSVQIARYPGSYEEMVRELAFEHLKLCFIRDAKLYRQRIAMGAAVTWVLAGALLLLNTHTVNKHANEVCRQGASTSTSLSVVLDQRLPP